MPKIAFICYGNACRSQIAEALLKSLVGSKFEVYSAGIHPLGKVPKETSIILKMRGIEASGLYSKALSEIPLKDLDYLVSLMGHPIDEEEPLFSGIRLIWDIFDPYGGTIEDYSIAYNAVEKKIRENFV